MFVLKSCWIVSNRREDGNIRVEDEINRSICLSRKSGFPIYINCSIQRIGAVVVQHAAGTRQIGREEDIVKWLATNAGE